MIDQLLESILSPPVFVPIIFPGIGTIMPVIIFIIWLERKIAAKVQLRYGPLYILKALGGIIQLVADLVRILFAEVIIPRGTDARAFIVAPFLSFTFAFLPVVAFPIGPNFFAFRSELNLLIVLALITVSPVFILMMGWASDNKFAFIGSLREGYVIMAYEIPLFISVLAVAVMYNTLDFVELVEIQTGGLWGLILNPIAALTFLLCIFMVTARYPYEVAEAEQELVVGPSTEYSGIMFGLAMAYAYVKLYVLSLLFAYLFLGGWNPLIWPFTLHPTLPGLVLLIKGLIIMVLSIFMRSVYPRFRVDQILRIGWRELLILSFVSLFLSIGLIVLGVVQ